MYEIASPKWPKKLDQALVDRGYNLYHSEQLHCSSCHGGFKRLGVRNKYQFIRSRIVADVAYKFAKTDIQYWQTMFNTSYVFTEHVHTNKQFLEHSGRAFGPRPGPVSADEEYKTRPYYDAPPLIGVWASAPYLHNGSVPTLWDLLQHEDNRPKQWKLNQDFRAYDYDRVGAEYTNAVVDRDWETPIRGGAS